MTNNKKLVNKKSVFCTKCGKKNSIDSTFCANCGAKLVNLKKTTEEPAKKREEDDKLNQITLKNMSSKIFSATFIAAKVITKTSIITFKPKQPTVHDGYTTKAFVILDGPIRYISDVTDEVKKKILNDLGTDLNINQVDWAKSSSISIGLRHKGWNALLFGTQWYIWPANGSTVKSLITIDYIGGIPKVNTVKGKVYSQEDMKRNKSSEAIWIFICFIILIIIIIFLVAK